MRGGRALQPQGGSSNLIAVFGSGYRFYRYLFEVIPGKHVFISTYRCRLLGGFVPTVSHEHKEVGLFAADQLPANLPQGYRDSIVKALGIRGSAADGRPQIPRA